MISVAISSVEDFRSSIIEKLLPEKFKIKVGTITQQSYGKEVNVIDLAGVCWHFVE